jgi:hypothetical protein
MPVTAPKLLIKQAHTLPGALPQVVKDIARFLNNDDNGPPAVGPGWNCIWADDLTLFGAPTSAGKINNLVGANLWKAAGTLLDGSWIVLESLDGNNTNHCQIALQMFGTNLRYWLLPYQDFVTPAGTTASPVMPSTALGPIDADASATVAAATLNVAADEGMVAWLLVNPGAQAGHFVYMGELDEGPGDRNYVMYDSPADVHVTDSSTIHPWRGISLRDGTSLLLGSKWVNMCDGSGRSMAENDRKNLLGVDPIFRAGVFLWLSGNNPGAQTYFAGWLRNIRPIHEDVGVVGTIANRQWMYFSDETIGSFPPIAIAWDGVTDFP